MTRAAPLRALTQRAGTAMADAGATVPDMARGKAADAETIGGTSTMKGIDGMDARGTGGTSPEAVAPDGWRACRLLREIAADLLGPRKVEARWRTDGAMRSKQRRLRARAGARAGAGTDTDPEIP